MVYPKQQNGDHLKVKALYKTGIDYNGEGRKWEFVTMMTTKHEHTKHKLEYHESQRHQHHKPQTTRTASSRTRDDERGHQHDGPRTTRTASTRTRNDERGHQHHGPRTTRTASTRARKDEWSEVTPDQRSSGSQAPTPTQVHGHTSRRECE